MSSISILLHLVISLWLISREILTVSNSSNTSVIIAYQWKWSDLNHMWKERKRTKCTHEGNRVCNFVSDCLSLIDICKAPKLKSTYSDKVMNVSRGDIKSTSRDVIHCLSLPCLGIKQDCVPGRYYESTVTCNMQGVCWVMHGIMRSRS